MPQVLPFFLCSENNTELDRVGRRYHAQGGPMNVERFPWQPAITADLLYAAAEAGYPISEDLNGDRIVGFTVAQMNQKDGARVTSNSAFLQPVRHRRNLHVLLNATVTRVLFENQRAVGVQYYKNGAFRYARATRSNFLFFFLALEFVSFFTQDFFFSFTSLHARFIVLFAIFFIFLYFCISSRKIYDKMGMTRLFRTLFGKNYFYTRTRTNASSSRTGYGQTTHYKSIKESRQNLTSVACEL